MGRTKIDWCVSLVLHLQIEPQNANNFITFFKIKHTERLNTLAEDAGSNGTHETIFHHPNKDKNRENETNGKPNDVIVIR